MTDTRTHDGIEDMERYRPELRVHCYRMVGSFEEAEDLVQETFLRAWRRRDSFEGRSSYRAWLYRIATNVCLDHLRRRKRRAPKGGPGSPDELPWLQPYPDVLLDEVAAADDGPDVAAVARETIELSFLAALQHLTPRQRAVFVLRDVLGWTAEETAATLESSVASMNSALQRARAALQDRRPADRLEWAPPAPPGEAEQAVLRRYMDATERLDAAAVVAVLREDIRLTMPPQDCRYDGLDAVGAFFVQLFVDLPGEWRMVPTRANRQPAAANYLRAPGESEFTALVLDVLRIEDGTVAEITSFEPHLFPAFGLPLTL